jgi:Sulfotransferase family
VRTGLEGDAGTAAHPTVRATWAPRAEEWLAQAPSRFAGQPDRPLFIGACPRSGTTLLRSMLNNHPDLAVPAETDFVIPVWTNRGRVGDLALEANRRRLAEWIMDTPGRGGKRIRAGTFSRDEAIARVVAAPGTLGSVFAALFALFADGKRKPRWGDKRPAYAVYLDALFALFPDAQFVNLVRDPRAAVESQMRVPWYAEYGQPASAPAVATWEYAIRRVDAFAPRLRPDQLLDVRYEDLVRDPRGELRRICEFAGLRDGAALDDMIDRPRGGFTPGWHDNVSEPVTPGLIENWRERLEPHEIALVESAARPYLDRFGYAHDERIDVAPPRSERRWLAANRRRRAIKWRRYALGERKRRLTHRYPVAAERA